LQNTIKDDNEFDCGSGATQTKYAQHSKLAAE